MSTNIKATDTGATYSYQSDGNFLDDVIGNSGDYESDESTWLMSDDDARWWMEWAEREEAINAAYDIADADVRVKAEQLVSDWGHDFEELQRRECELYGIDYDAFEGTKWLDETTAAKKTVYSVYETPMIAHQVGERYAYEMDGCESSFLAEFDTLDEAIAFANEHVLDAPEVHKTRYGLDFVTYSDIKVNTDEYDAGEDEWECVETTCVCSGLTDAVKKAMEKHEQAYWAFLDYKAAYYPQLSELI